MDHEPVNPADSAMPIFCTTRSHSIRRAQSAWPKTPLGAVRGKTHGIGRAGVAGGFFCVVAHGRSVCSRGPFVSNNNAGVL
jgi:hypothetical protein